jgi:hypothetical protein
MEQLTEQQLPPDLRTENYHYPIELFEDYKRELPSDGNDDTQVEEVPVEMSERPVLMARYAVAKALRLACAEDRLLKIARLEIEDCPTFLSGVRKIRRSIVCGDLEKGDIELKADELGVYEIIFPLNQKKMRQAEEDERALLSGAAN